MGKGGTAQGRAMARSRRARLDAARARAGASPAVSTASVYGPRLEGGGRRILVTRYYPRGIRRSHFDDWARALAPGKELLRRHKAGSIPWRDFVGAFLAEVYASEEARSALLGLRREARRGGVTLLCFERDGAHCHRHILRRLVEQPSPARIGPFEPDCTDHHRGVPMARLHCR